MTVEQVRPCTGTNDMRAEIFRLRHEDPLVRNVLTMADYTGMSSEDRYALLAFEALKQLNAIKQRVLEDFSLRVDQTVIQIPS